MMSFSLYIEILTGAWEAIHISIQVENVTKTIRKKSILKGANIEIPCGITALVGVNGSGKSSLVRCIVGQWRATNGRILIDGATPERSRRSTGFLQDPPAFYEHLTAEAMLRYYAAMSGKPWKGEYARLLQSWSVPLGVIRSFSRGQRQRLGIVCSYWHSPNLWVLDEPFTGLDGEGVALLWETVASYAKQKAGYVLMVVHGGQGFPRSIDYVVDISKGCVDYCGGALTYCEKVLNDHKGIISAKWAEVLNRHKIGYTPIDDAPMLQIKAEGHVGTDTAEILWNAGFNPLSKEL